MTYGYEKGACATIPIHWDDASRTLTIGERKGTFPGMLESRTFTVIVVDPAHPSGFAPDASGTEVTYEGAEITCKA